MSFIPLSEDNRLYNNKAKNKLFLAVAVTHLVRVTGLEPVRRATHAPQTCLSANSSTLAFITSLEQ